MMCGMLPPYKPPAPPSGTPEPQRDRDPGDETVPAPVRVVPPCPTRCGQCSQCLERWAGLSMNRLLWGRWLVEHEQVSDGEPAVEREGEG